MLKQEPKHADALSAAAVRKLQARLLAWYSKNRRDLPWRHTTDPYPVWVAEVMLQQTQVQTVIPYYHRFLARFPSIEALAGSSTEDLLHLWAGLGYYSRARNLQRAACLIVERFGGQFPNTHAGLAALPGIGRYTAAAILSIAFGQPYAVLDGNVTRVLARLLSIEGDPGSTPVQKWLWRSAQTLLPLENPGDFNQAVMELGATVCSPRQPRCCSCPWQWACAAHKEGRQEVLPAKRPRAAARKSRQAAIVLRHRGRYWIVHRNGQRLLEGFWEFPSAEFSRAPSNLGAAVSRWIRRQHGLKVRHLRPLLTVKHSITVRRIELAVFEAELGPGSPRAHGGNGRWVRLSEMEHLPFPSASRQILQALRQRAGNPIRA